MQQNIEFFLKLKKPPGDMVDKNVPRCYILKCLIRDLLSNVETLNHVSHDGVGNENYKENYKSSAEPVPPGHKYGGMKWKNDCFAR